MSPELVAEIVRLCNVISDAAKELRRLAADHADVRELLDQIDGF